MMALSLDELIDRLNGWAELPSCTGTTEALRDLAVIVRDHLSKRGAHLSLGVCTPWAPLDSPPDPDVLRGLEITVGPVLDPGIARRIHACADAWEMDRGRIAELTACLEAAQKTAWDHAEALTSVRASLVAVGKQRDAARAELADVKANAAEALQVVEDLRAITEAGWCVQVRPPVKPGDSYTGPVGCWRDHDPGTRVPLPAKSGKPWTAADVHAVRLAVCGEAPTPPAEPTFDTDEECRAVITECGACIGECGDLWMAAYPMRVLASPPGTMRECARWAIAHRQGGACGE